MVRTGDGRKGKERTMSPGRDITPLLGSKLPQLRLSCLPIYKVIDVSVRVVSRIYFFGDGATMTTKEKERSLFPAGTAVFIGRAL